MKATKQANVLTRAVTRDLPLFMISASYGAHLRDLSEDILGFRLSQNFVLFDRGTAIIHRDNKEWFNEMPKLWATALQNKKSSENIKKFVQYTARSIRDLEMMQLEPTTSCLNKLRKTISRGVAGMIFAHWLPIYNEQKLAIYEPDDVHYFEKSRQEIEKFFGMAADIAYAFLDLLAKEYDLSVSLLKYATHDELIVLILSSEINTTTLNVRKNQKILFVEDILYLGAGSIHSYLNERGYIFDKPPLLPSGIIKGVVACRGVATVTGKIQIINSRKQFSQFEEGNILVAPMTSPDYVPLIQKARAVITDEGGMLSHAAIVSRELDKLCVVGTKSASYVLKNFQEVEVDAERGIIRILL